MLKFIDAETNAEVIPSFMPHINVFGHYTQNNKLFNNYKKVLQHYYIKWYDLTENLREGLLTPPEQKEYRFNQTDNGYNREDYVYEGLNANTDQLGFFQLYTWLNPSNKEIFDGLDGLELKMALYKHVPLVTPPIVTCYNKENLSKVYNMPIGVFSDYIDKKESDFINTRNFLHLEKRTDNKLYQLGLERVDLNIIVHSRHMNEKYRNLCMNVCNHYAVDIVEVFENNIFIHVHNHSHLANFYEFFNTPESECKKYKHRICSAQSISGDPRLKLSRYKKSKPVEK